MIGNPKVSVIIPVYNTELYLPKCLDSVINQTLNEIEIIAINDGSTDNSLKILNEYKNKDFRITILEQTNGGAGKARNFGIQNAKGDYLYFLDSDDYLEPNFLHDMYNKIVEENSDICICKYNEVRKDNNAINQKDTSLLVNLLPTKHFNYKNITNNLFQFCSISVWTKLYKRDFVLENKVYFQEQKTVNDVYFNYATLILAKSITYLDQAMVNYRIDVKNSLTSQRGKTLNDIISAYTQIRTLLEKNNLLNDLQESMYRKMISSIKYEMSYKKANKRTLYKQMAGFIPKKYVKKYYKEKTLLQQIFSIKNEDKHKVLTILGIRIKFTPKNHIKNYRTYSDLSNIIKDYVQKNPFNEIDLIVGIPRSGMIPAYMMAAFLNKKVCSLQEFKNGLYSSNGVRSIPTKGQIKNILIVDDSILSGHAINEVKNVLSSEEYSQFNFKYLTVFATEKSKNKVDYYMQICQAPRLFQWNYLNHKIATASCYDMDGVLCVDPTSEENDDGEKYRKFCLTAKPLFIPSYCIKAIVTSRLEKFRKETEQWLKDNNVKYEKLYMLDVKTAEERRKLGLHAKYKAEIYKKLKQCKLFVESEPRQAKEIFKLTGKPCVCVATDEYYSNELEK